MLSPKEKIMNHPRNKKTNFHSLEKCRVREELAVAIGSSMRKLPTGKHFPLPGTGERGQPAVVDIVACRRAEAAKSAEEGALKNLPMAMGTHYPHTQWVFTH